ncbi:uncharacterized protein [Miscanthus floridulus]|uniref:uncharacterized protein n=1 Tax=Miscanthus floridulus TaxID=154761 RepID=UPI00345A36DD
MFARIRARHVKLVLHPAATSVPCPCRPERALSLSLSLPLSPHPAGEGWTGRSCYGAVPLYDFQALKTMRKAKRSGGHFTRSFHKNRRACKTEWVSGRLHDEDCTQDVFTKLSDQVKSDFCKSVVSISLCNGDITLFSCSGIAIARQGHNLTRFLTSASLVRAFHGKTNEHYYDLKIEVRHEGKKVYRFFFWMNMI